MRREILQLRRHVTDCCPGHDPYPNDTYSNNRSKRARSRDKKKEHRHARRVKNYDLKVLVQNTDQEHLKPVWDEVEPIGNEIW